MRNFINKYIFSYSPQTNKNMQCTKYFQVNSCGINLSKTLCENVFYDPVNIAQQGGEGAGSPVQGPVAMNDINVGNKCIIETFNKPML